MRNMSFKLTTPQFIDGTKDVTRRLGWALLRKGEHFMAVRQAQGLKKGQKIEQLGECICKSNIPERLDWIGMFPVRGRPEDMHTKPEVEREGFPDLTPEQFVDMFCKEMHCTPSTIINRIEFERCQK